MLLMSRNLYVVLLIAFIGFANCFPNEEAQLANETNKLETDDESRIVGGKKASKNQFPYMVSIQKFYDGVIGWYPMCGGSVISKRTILTAAHCISPKPTQEMRIVTGSLNSIPPDGNAQIRKVAAFKPHPDFKYDKTGKIINDIGLIIVDTPLIFGPNVQPVTLSMARPTPGMTGHVSGWGDTVANRPDSGSRELLYADAQIYPMSNCEKRFGKLSETSQICVGKIPSAFLESVCKGDSGGPIVIGNKVEGVVSYSSEICGLSEVVFTGVNHFTPWIRKNME